MENRIDEFLENEGYKPHLRERPDLLVHTTIESVLVGLSSDIAQGKYESFVVFPKVVDSKVVSYQVYVKKP